MDNVEFALQRQYRNGERYVLYQCKIVVGNRIQKIKWYHLQVPATTGNARHIKLKIHSACRAISASAEILVKDVTSVWMNENVS